MTTLARVKKSERAQALANALADGLDYAGYARGDWIKDWRWYKGGELIEQATPALVSMLKAFGGQTDDFDYGYYLGLVTGENCIKIKYNFEDDDDDAKWVTLSRRNVARGVRLMGERYPAALGSILEGERCVDGPMCELFLVMCICPEMYEQYF